MKTSATMLIFLAVFSLSSPVSARSSRVNQIPNGRNFTCDSCHGRQSLGVNDLTPFGVDVNRTMSGGNVTWSAIWDLDSDADGFTNGVELGDPAGNWRPGQPQPDAPTANPGVPNQGLCGNDDAEPDEECDLSDLRGESCESLGFGLGVLGCHSLCRWDTSQCGPCGDGYINPRDEDCDGSALPTDLSCVDYGFLRGELSCNDVCDIDVSTCTDAAPAVCGDGIISTGELCDGDNFGTVDCARIAYAGGDLECTDDCKWDASNCLLADGRRVGDDERAAADPGDPFPGTTNGGDVGVSASDVGVDMGRGNVDAGGGCSVAGDARESLPWWMCVIALVRLRKRRGKFGFTESRQRRIL